MSERKDLFPDPAETEEEVELVYCDFCNAFGARRAIDPETPYYRVELIGGDVLIVCYYCKIEKFDKGPRLADAMKEKQFYD